MRERIKGKTLVARDEGDHADGVLVKLYGEETNGAISIIEQPFEAGLLLPPHVHDNDVWLYVLAGEMHARVGDRADRARRAESPWRAARHPFLRRLDSRTTGGLQPARRRRVAQGRSRE
jgi:hypothetical protein